MTLARDATPPPSARVGTLVSAALCPSAPLLAPALGGGHPAVPELRAAAARAVAAMLAARPDLVVVVGAAPTTSTWAGDTPVDLGPFLGVAATPGPALPLALALGATLLRAAGPPGPARYQGVAADAAPAACLALGRSLVEGPRSVALLVVGDGSARRTLKAPGWFDARAAAFDAAAERAVRAGDLAALRALDPDLAADLQATGRAAWQVLAGAGEDLPCVAELDYADAPFGVGYLVASLRFGDRRRGDP